VKIGAEKATDMKYYCDTNKRKGVGQEGRSSPEIAATFTGTSS
jgi:hypothetical protein